MTDNTFLGLQPYTEADAYRFKGRTEESQELFRLIVRNDYTVCYSESGEGKTSLLNAGVFPLLRENMHFPISITFTSDDYKVTPDSFDAIIDRCIKDSIAEYNEKNKGVYVEYRLSSTDFHELDSQAELQRELSKHSWWKLRNYSPQTMGLTFTPVFVFDQFEEVFNLPGSIVWTKKFFDWLENVSSDSCPDEIVERVRAVIGGKAAFPNIKEEKGFKAVFSLRKEFIGEMDYWGMQTHFIPALKDNRYCLKALTYEGAKKVMTQQERFDEDKVEQVLMHFVGQYSREPERTIAENLPAIPALLLSVVCGSWEKDIAAFAKLSTDEIGLSLNMVLEKFYDETIEFVVKELTHRNKDALTTDSICKDIDTAMFDLVDVNGKRVRVKAVTTLGTISMDNGRRFSETLPITKYKEILNTHRIIKITKIDGEDYVEIVHDCLCPIIAKRREIILEAEANEREEQRIRYQTQKMRERMVTFAVLSLVVIGIMTIFLWQNSRYLLTQKSLDLSEQQRDSMNNLNTLLGRQMDINNQQKDSISNLNTILSRQRDSLIQSLSIQNSLYESLNKNTRIINAKNDSLNRYLKTNKDLTSSLYKQLQLNKLKTDSLERVLLIMKEQNEYIQQQENKFDIIETVDNLSVVKSVCDICLNIRQAYQVRNIELLKTYNESFKDYNPMFFNGLKCLDNTETSLSGHFFFNPLYIDGIIRGDDLMSFNETGTPRSLFKSVDGSVFIKNCCVLAKKSTKYSFLSRGRQEIAIISEPDGFVTLRVHDKTHDKWYNDLNNIKMGQPSRFISIDLPSTERTELELEVINTTQKDISFVIVSN